MKRAEFEYKKVKFRWNGFNFYMNYFDARHITAFFF